MKTQTNNEIKNDFICSTRVAHMLLSSTAQINILYVKPIDWLADIIVWYQYINIGKLDIGIDKLDIGIGNISISIGLIDIGYINIVNHLHLCLTVRKLEQPKSTSINTGPYISQ